MPRLLLLLPTSTYRTQDFLDAARKLGIDLTVASEKPSTFENQRPADLLTLNFRYPKEAVRKAVEFSRTVPIHAVLGVDDETTLAAGEIASALSLPHNTVGSISAAQNKYEMRERLSRRGIPVPAYRRYSIDDDAASLARSIKYPCVLKPLILFASRGVIRADNEKEFRAAFQRLKVILRSPDLAHHGSATREFLVEDFIPGQEVALEGLLIDGKLHPLALFDKPDPLNGPYFEETIYVTPSRLPPEKQAEIISSSSRAVEALGLKEGPIHAELRINEKGVWIIEIAARSIGGRCSRALRFGTGMSLEEVILRHALRMDLPDLEREKQAAGVMMLPVPRAGIFNRVEGLTEAGKVPGIEEVSITAHPGQAMEPLPEGSPSYVGFIFARGDTPEQVEAALRESHRQLQIIIKPK